MAKADSTSWKCKMLFSEATRDLAHSAVERKGVFSPLKVFPAPPKPAGQEAVSGMRECLELFGHNLCNEGERIKCDMEATYFPLPSIPPPARRTSDGPCNIHRLSFIACSRKHLFPLVRNPPSPIS